MLTWYWIAFTSFYSRLSYSLKASSWLQPAHVHHMLLVIACMVQLRQIFLKWHIAASSNLEVLQKF